MSPNSKALNEGSRKAALLFVYGTLMRGQRLHHHLEKHNNSFLGQAKIRAKLYYLPGRRYPGAVLTSRPDSFVHGELYEIENPPEMLRIIDKLEGRDEGLFSRKLVDVWQGGRKSKAWAYFYAKPLARAEHIPAGKYLQQSVRASRGT